MIVKPLTACLLIVRDGRLCSSSGSGRRLGGRSYSVATIPVPSVAYTVEGITDGGEAVGIMQDSGTHGSTPSKPTRVGHGNCLILTRPRSRRFGQEAIPWPLGLWRIMVPSGGRSRCRLLCWNRIFRLDCPTRNGWPTLGHLGDPFCIHYRRFAHWSHRRKRNAWLLRLRRRVASFGRTLCRSRS